MELELAASPSEARELCDDMSPKAAGHVRADEILRIISEGTASAKGEEFFRSLARHLASALRVKYAFVAECTDATKTRVRTLAVWNGRRFIDNVTYGVAGTPCEHVMDGEVCLHPTSVQTLFPRDHGLASWNTESYLGVPVRGSSGDVLGHLAVLDEKPLAADAREISILKIFAERTGVELERQRAEDSLRESEARYRSLYNKTPVMLHSIDAKTRLVSVSEHWLQMLGYERSDVIGQSVTHFLTEASRLHVEQTAMPIFMKTGALFDLPIQFEKRNGEIVDALLSAIAERDADGNFVRSLSVSVDVTQRKRAEESVERHTKRLETLREIDRGILAARSPAEIGDAAVLHIRQLIPCLRASVTIFDFDAGQAVWQAVNADNAGEMSVGSGISFEPFGSLDALREGKVNVVEDARTLPSTPVFDLLRAEGLLSWINVPLVARGELIGTLNVGSDRVAGFSSEDIDTVREVADSLAIATQQARLNDQVQRHTAELEQRIAERTAELEAFSYSVAHDLRAPLRAIAGFSNVLLEEHAANLNPEGLRVLRIISDSTRNMGHLIDDLLSLSRLGRQEMKLTDIDMGQLARSVFAELESTDPARRVELSIDALPPARGDRGMIRQVLANLFSNAFKFTASRETAEIEIGVESTSGENAYYVKDNGVGFDMRYAEKMFGVFQRLHRAEDFEGTGVGLAIVQSVIQRHGGRVWAEGKLNEGATIWFTLIPAATKKS